MPCDRNPAQHLIWRLYGRVKLLQDGAERERSAEQRLKSEIDRDPERKGFAVVVRVDRIREGARIIREADRPNGAQRARWKELD